MMQINPKDLKVSEIHQYMLGAIAPRPIAFVSTVDAEGRINLSPFSFFNAFGANPPTVIFSPALRGRDGASKNTLDNVKATKEAVINVVSYEMVQQMSLASSEYTKGVNEFIKAGFTEQASVHVKAPRVKESPVQMECIVKEIISTGESGGAGQLVVCEIVLIHINEEILDSFGKIDPIKIDLVSRLGGDWYGRSSQGLFKIPKPLTTLGIGVDQLPDTIRLSKILTGNDLGMLGNTEKIPLESEIKSYRERKDVKKLFDVLHENHENLTTAVHLAAHKMLSEGNATEAWMILLSHHS